jgi:hypothetical protein
MAIIKSVIRNVWNPVIGGIINDGHKSAWTPLMPLGGEAPSYKYVDGTRNGLVMPNAMNPGTNDASLLLPHLNTYLATNGYAYINDNGSMDIINNLGTNPLGNSDQGYTLCGRINSQDSNKTTAKNFLGKMIAGGRNGRFGIYANITTGYLVAALQSSGGFVSITGAVDWTSLTFPFVLMDVNYTTKKLRFFVNNIQIGVDTAFTGTLAQLANEYRFYIGANNTDVTGAATSITKASFVDVKIFNKILTSTQQTQEYTTHDVAGAVNFYPCNNTYLADSGTGGKHLTSVALDRTNVQYDVYGSRHLLNVGYSKFTNYPSKEVHVAYKQDGTVLNYTPSGYTHDSDVAGSLTSHNGADSILIPTIGTVDRSDTAKCTYLTTLTGYQYYYNSGYKTGLCSVEATNLRILNYYKSINHFFKRNGQTITDWLIYPTGKTGGDYAKAINWTGEDVRTIFGSGSYLSIGIDSVYAGSSHLYLGKATSDTGDFMPIAVMSYPGAPAHIGNATILPLNVNKCNGSVKPVIGEVNFLMIHESMTAGYNALHLYTSYNGVDWIRKMYMPLTNDGNTLGMEGFYVDNDDPTDYHNIHYIGFRPIQKTIYESHPLTSDFSSWSTFVPIFTVPGVPLPYNAIITLISGTYHMFYSAWDVSGNTHYMHHATCTHDPFTASNDWTEVQTGNWSGLGNMESCSLINRGGSNWILYYIELNVSFPATSVYKYSLSTDNCATWSAGVTIPGLSVPLQFAAGILKLK